MEKNLNNKKLSAIPDDLLKKKNNKKRTLIYPENSFSKIMKDPNLLYENSFEQNIKNPHLYSENRLENLKNSTHIYWKSFKTIKKAHLYSEDSFVWNSTPISCISFRTSYKKPHLCSEDPL